MSPTRIIRTLVLTLVFCAGLPIPSADAQTARDAIALTAAFKEMRAGEWEAALEEAARAGPVARDIIDWHRLRAGKGTFDEVRSFLERHSDWPGLDYLRRRSEGVVPYRARADEVIAYFEDSGPQTGAGMIVQAAALETVGNPEAAKPILVRAWRELPLSTGDENYMLERYRALLKPHHEARLDMLLWEDEQTAAERMIPRVSEGWQALARARIALRNKEPGVDTLIAKVPSALRADPGLAYERFLWRMRKGRNESAVELALTREGTVESLGRPGAWSNSRRLLTRRLMRQGQAETAYRLASAHGLTEGSHFADLEWLSGYLALTYLDDAERALGHFRAFREAVVTPISLGRAGYWEGRALEALDRTDDARAAYAEGGAHQTSFYGLLAAERAGLPMDPALTGKVDYPDWATADFASSTVLEAAMHLYRAGYLSLAERFLTHLAESLDPTQQGQLADLAFSLEEPHIALMIAKRAASMGVVLPHAYFPVVDLGLGELSVPRELALAIARRESEFDPRVKSGAGAMGLMQVMPGTAREVAGWLNVKYDRDRLLSDPVYNARLGVAYLAELVSIFGNNFVLVSAGYNAGPGRPVRWIDGQGDPRTAEIDAVDWIEHIPFRETRNYVMRVMESLPVYRARLSGETVPIRLSAELKAE